MSKEKEPGGNSFKPVASKEFSKGKSVEKYALENGLTVIVLEDHSAPVFSFQTWFKVGSRFEKKGKTGIAHLFEHLMFKGTEAYPHGVFDRILEESGAQSNAATWLDWTYYYENIGSEFLELVVKLESDRMKNLILNEEQLASEREVVKNERRLRVDNDPSGKMYETLFELAFQSHPYGLPTIGYMEDLDAITLKDCLEFYRLYYSAGNAILVVVGDVKTGELLKLIDKYYGKYGKEKIPPEKEVKEPAKKEKKSVTLTLPVSSEKIKIAYRVPPVMHKDVPALEVLNEILLGSDSSLIYKKLVEDLQIAAYAAGWVGSLARDGIYEISITMREGFKASEAEKAVDEIISGAASGKIKESDVEKAKNKLEIDLIRSLYSFGSRASQLGYYEATTGDFSDFFEVMHKYSEVSKDDVVNAAKKYLGAEGKSVVTAVPSGVKHDGDENDEGE